MGASKGKVSVTKMQFSEKLSQLRRKAGLSQEQLADRLGVTRQSVSKWESGTAVPELGKLIALSELFEVSVDYLVKDWVEEEASANDERLEETVADLARYMKGYTYDSKTRVFGIPLVSIRLTRHGLFGSESVAKGIIAIGNAAVGVVALGAASVGAFSLGAFSVGVLSIGALAAGACSLGALAVGVAAFGSAAVGVYAGGVAAVGDQIAVGVAAMGQTAIGQEATGQHTLLWGNGLAAVQVEQFLKEHHPDLWEPLLRLFSFLGAHIQ